MFTFNPTVGSGSVSISFRKFTKIEMYEIKIYLSIKFYFIEKQIKEKNRDFINKKFVHSDAPWFRRGAIFVYGTSGGVNVFGSYSGYLDIWVSFRKLTKIE